MITFDIFYPKPTLRSPINQNRTFNSPNLSIVSYYSTLATNFISNQTINLESNDAPYIYLDDINNPIYVNTKAISFTPGYTPCPSKGYCYEENYTYLYVPPGQHIIGLFYNGSIIINLTTIETKENQTIYFAAYIPEISQLNNSGIINLDSIPSNIPVIVEIDNSSNVINGRTPISYYGISPGNRLISFPYSIGNINNTLTVYHDKLISNYTINQGENTYNLTLPVIYNYNKINKELEVYSNPYLAEVYISNANKSDEEILNSVGDLAGYSYWDYFNITSNTAPYNLSYINSISWDNSKNPGSPRKGLIKVTAKEFGYNDSSVILDYNNLTIPDNVVLDFYLDKISDITEGTNTTRWLILLYPPDSGLYINNNKIAIDAKNKIDLGIGNMSYGIYEFPYGNFTVIARNLNYKDSHYTLSLEPWDEPIIVFNLIPNNSSEIGSNVTIITTPPGASIELYPMNIYDENGSILEYPSEVDYVRAPLSMYNIRSGKYYYYIYQYNYSMDYGSFNLSNGENLTLNFTLQHWNYTYYGAAHITTNPTSAEIYFNGVYEGLSPLDKTYLSYGSYMIVAKKSGYNDASTTLVINSTYMVNVNLNINAITQTPVTPQNPSLPQSPQMQYTKPAFINSNPDTTNSFLNTNQTSSDNIQKPLTPKTFKMKGVWIVVIPLVIVVILLIMLFFINKSIKISTKQNNSEEEKNKQETKIN